MSAGKNVWLGLPHCLVCFTLVLLGIGGMTTKATADCADGKKITLYETSVNPDDTESPGQVIVEEVLVVRGEDTEGTLCVSVGSLGFAVEAPADNVTGADSLGYVVEWLSGSPINESFYPDQGPGTPIEAVDGVVWMNFSDLREEALSGSFRLAAMDEAGNQGEFSEAVSVEHPGESSGGCATTSGGDSGPMAFFGLALLVLRLRRV